MRHYLLHQALPVEEGVKYVLRFNVLYERFGTKGWYEGRPRPELKIPQLGEKYNTSHDRLPITPRVYYLFIIRASYCSVTYPFAAIAEENRSSTVCVNGSHSKRKVWVLQQLIQQQQVVSTSSTWSGAFSSR